MAIALLSVSCGESTSVGGLLMDWRKPFSAVPAEALKILEEKGVLEKSAHFSSSGALQVQVLNLVYPADVETNLAKVEREAIRNCQAVPGMDVSINRRERTTISGMEARRLSLDIESSGTDALGMEGLLIARDQRLWQVLVLFSRDDTDAQAEANDLLASVRVGG